MAIVETVVVGHVVALLLLFAWAIHGRGKVGLIAGYDGGLPPEREADLARDAAVVLVVAAAATSLIVVDAWTGAVPRPDVAVTLAIAGAAGWFLWKWNGSEDRPAG
ncbi:hypothetical protein C463_09019 [Halorubrum californiense DSM 19288]|uniref:Uncharacterized protein n=1 Tax=Halorubrum californiense DSM 19288 TaxID=1227465 RepID=M0E9Q4_9EURY|nr:MULTISPECIES: hypothetical protein [Halorubrum]ELZ43798.1 hypothetical protein C463_09019 [Halorubrum californiense DSM 19288]TKX72788.1 hypothetical protein EXE40_02100 [Halorubrum sp. GN11GM_10-3_MGM]